MSLSITEGVSLLLIGFWQEATATPDTDYTELARISTDLIGRFLCFVDSSSYERRAHRIGTVSSRAVKTY
jgi:hypothetical protein